MGKVRLGFGLVRVRIQPLGPMHYGLVIISIKLKGLWL